MVSSSQKTAIDYSAPIEVKTDKKYSYHIYPELSFDSLADRINELDLKDRRIVVITDSNVEKLYLKEVMEKLRPVCAEISSCIIPAGESHKNLDEIRKIYVHLINHQIDRKDLLVALGGGVTGDMTGFAAATYLRGIRFIQIPTTLLSQVDSSIGGKTGVDFEQYKNMVGAFWQPSMVYINLSVLGTLDGAQFASGMGETLKHGIIRDEAYYEWCLDHMDKIQERRPEVLQEMVVRSLLVKKQIVEKDPFEKGDRALLNFGHTCGHAIEKLKNFELTHGACVALGMTAAAYISWKRDLIDDMTFYEIRDMFVGFDLPISYDSLRAEDILKVTKHDKKMNGKQIRFVLLKKLGNAFLDDTVTDEEILAALNFLSAADE